MLHIEEKEKSKYPKDFALFFPAQNHIKNSMKGIYEYNGSRNKCQKKSEKKNRTITKKNNNNNTIYNTYYNRTLQHNYVRVNIVNINREPL